MRMFRHILDRSDIILFRDTILDHLINRVWMGNIVYSPNIIPLLEDEVSITQDIADQPMSFDIDLQDTLHIHEFDIIDEEEARMDEEDRMIRYEHEPSEVVDRVHDQLEKYIIHRHQENRKDDEIAQITRKYSLILIDDPYEESYWDEEKEKFRGFEYEEDAMTQYRSIVYAHMMST